MRLKRVEMERKKKEERERREKELREQGEKIMEESFLEAQRELYAMASIAEMKAADLSKTGKGVGVVGGSCGGSWSG